MKKKLILGSALGIIMCSSLIAGATMALFTSESKVNIAVTSGKVDVTATATEVTTYSRGEQTQDGTFENGGTAKIEGGELILDKVTPGDKAVVALKITNNSNVAQQQRISLTGSLDANLMDQLIIGVSETDSNFTYYSDYTTAWTKVEAVTEPVTTTMYVSIELPEYVKNDWQDKSCEITISVEAVQGNADVTSTTVANEVYLVNDQEELTNAIAEMQRGETVILYGGEENWETADIEYTEVKEITVRGYKVGTMTINAPNGTINLYNDVNTLNVEAIAGNSLHIYGNIVSAEVADGRAVVEPGAYVKNVNVVPSESNSVKFEVKKEATVTNIKVNTSETASSADVVIAEGVEVSDMTVEGSGDVTLDNSGTISNTTVSEDSNLNSAVATAEQLIAALKISGTTVTLGKDISIDSVVLQNAINSSSVKNFVIDLNQNTLTMTGNSSVGIAGDGVSLTIKNGNFNANNTTLTSASITVESSCSVEFDHVNVVAQGSFLFPRGDAASASVKDCDIDIDGTYAIGTNAATTDNYNVVIEVNNSTINMHSADSTAVMINVAGTLNMNTVDIHAQRQGIIVRAGEANLTNVTVDAEIPYLDWEYELNYANNPSSWGSGNEVPYGALVVGNQATGSYEADAVVTITGGSYTCTAQDERVKERASALYAIKGTTYATSIKTTDATFDGKIVNYNNTAALEGFNDYTIITALVASAAEWSKIDDIVIANPDENYYFQQIADIQFTSQITKFCGTYDGNGYDLIRPENFVKGQTAAVIIEIVGHTTIKNVDLYMYDATALIGIADWGTCYGVDMENITTNAATENVLKCNINNFGFLIIDAIYTGSESPVTYNFKNCVNNASVENSGTCTGVFVGSGPCANGTLIINYVDCINNGEIVGTSSVGYLYGNSAYIESMRQPEYPASTINVSNCVNNGILRSNAENPIVAVAPKYSDVVPDTMVTGKGSLLATNAIKDLEFTIAQSGTNFSITTDNENYNYKLVFSVGATYFTKDGEAWTDEHTADIPNRNLSEVSNGIKYLYDLSVATEDTTGDLLTVKAYDKRTVVSEGVLTAEEVDALSYNADNYALYIKDNVTYMVFNVTDNYYINSSVSVLLYAYDTEGALVGIRTVK